MEFETSHQENQAGSRKKHSMVQGLPWPFMGLIMVLVLIMLLVMVNTTAMHGQYSTVVVLTV